MQSCRQIETDVQAEVERERHEEEEEKGRAAEGGERQ